MFELHPLEIALQFLDLLLESRLFLVKHLHLLSHARDFELLAFHHGLDDKPIRANRGQDDGDHAGHQPARANLGLVDRAFDRCLGSPFELLLELRHVRLRLSFEFVAKPGFEDLKCATIFGFLLSPCLGQGLLLGLPSCFFLGFPLHPPNQCEAVQADLLYRITCPMLFIQGTRDHCCDLNALRRALRRVGAPTSLITCEEADHDFQLPRDSLRADEDLHTEVLKSLIQWADEIIGES